MSRIAILAWSCSLSYDPLQLKATPIQVDSAAPGHQVSGDRLSAIHAGDLQGLVGTRGAWRSSRMVSYGRRVSAQFARFI